MDAVNVNYLARLMSEIVFDIHYIIKRRMDEPDVEPFPLSVLKSNNSVDKRDWIMNHIVNI